jgi:hypothetical protein
VPVLVHDRHRSGAHHAAVDRLEPRQHAHELALAVALDARDPHDLAAAHAQRHAAQRAPAAHVAHLELHVAEHARSSLQPRRRLLAHDVAREGGHRPGVAPIHRARRHELAAAQDAHRVGVVAHLVESVGDDDDRAPRVGQAAQRRVERRRLPGREHRRRLVEDDDARLAHERPHDLEALPLADAERLDGRVPRERHAHLARDRRRARPRALHVEPAHRAHRLGAEHHVVERAQDADEREVLLHHADAARDGLARRVRFEPPAVDAHLAGVGRDDAGGHLEQRALAGAVLAHDRVQPARLERERHVVDGVHRAVTLVESFEREQRGHGERPTLPRPPAPVPRIGVAASAWLCFRRSPTRGTFFSLNRASCSLRRALASFSRTPPSRKRASF